MAEKSMGNLEWNKRYQWSFSTGTLPKTNIDPKNGGFQ